MIPCKNHLAFTQYLKDKPVKWGIKSFLITNSTNEYVMNSEINTGVENEPVPEVGKTGNIGHRLLTSSKFANRGHTLVMDRYYNSNSSFKSSAFCPFELLVLSKQIEIFPKEPDF